MQDLPYRTRRTWLTDDQLILLDVLFSRGTFFTYLRREGFSAQWNLGYSHSLGDDALRCNLRWLCEHGTLAAQADGDQTVFRMTPAGGDLWSQERCPIWDRYCIECYRTTSRGRTMMTVYAVSPRVRDEFLALWPLYPARHPTVTIPDRGLIAWHPFGQLHAGVATYHEPLQWTLEEHRAWLERYREHESMLERRQSWWRYVEELQRFVPRPI
jgi:hypothetical protein